MNEIVSFVIAFAIGGISYVMLIAILKNKRKRRTTAEIIESLWAKMNKQDKGGTEMSNIEKIKAEIERLKAENRNIRCQHNDKYCNGYDDAFNDLLPIIDSLPEEKPSEDLEEEIKNYFEGLWPGTETAEQCNTDLYFTPPAIIRLARHFTEWQKEQMMKDAVEGFIICYNDDTYAVESCCLDNKEHHHHSGDKVKILIVKEKIC